MAKVGHARRYRPVHCDVLPDDPTFQRRVAGGIFLAYNTPILAEAQAVNRRPRQPNTGMLVGMYATVKPDRTSVRYLDPARIHYCKSGAPRLRRLAALRQRMIMLIRYSNGLPRSLTILLMAVSTPVFAQQQTVDRSANGAPGTDVRVGVYVNIKSDCTSGPLPSIRLVSAPEHGNITIKQGKVTATNYKQCLALEVPGFIAFYRSRADFAGVDVLTLEVKYPGGKTELQKISITVGTGSSGRGI